MAVMAMARLRLSKRHKPYITAQGNNFITLIVHLLFTCYCKAVHNKAVLFIHNTRERVSMEREPVTAENFVEALDELAAMEVLELVAELVYDNQYVFANTRGENVASYFEQPWKHPEIWVPLLNRRLGCPHAYLGERGVGKDYYCLDCGASVEAQN